MRRAGSTALVIGGLLLAAGCGWASSAGEPPPIEPAHKVTFQVTTIGTANDDLTIQHSGPAGKNVKVSWPAAAQFWSEEITTEPGQYLAVLSASGPSSDLAFKIECSVSVDGGRPKTSQAPYGCSVDVQLAPAAAAAKSDPRPSTPPTTAAPTPSAVRPAPDPVSCKYVTRQEVETIVNRLLGGGSFKPVLAVGGDASRCTYTFDYQSSSVSFSWAAGGKADTFPGGEVPGLGGTAYWMDVGSFGVLQVQLPKGAFKVTSSFQLLQVDKRAVAIEVFKAAKPRLPR